MSNPGEFSYGSYNGFQNFSYNIIKILMEENNLIWKLLKYNTSDAWNKPNLTNKDKSDLIYNGQELEENYCVFMDAGQMDSWVKESTILRIYPYSLYPLNRTYGNVAIMIDIFSHYKINHLSNYTTRVDSIVQSLLETLNGRDVGGIGNLFFDKIGFQDVSIKTGGSSPMKGKFLIMANKVS